MTQELLYTSAPRGLKPGSRGYCTVVSTQSMSAPLAQVLESLSGYRHIAPPGDPANPVAFSHVLLSAGGRKYRVVSRVCDSGLDYSGRSNKLAHHVALEPGELPAGGPAWLMQQPRFLLESWDGMPQLLPVGRSSLEGDGVQARCTTWQDMTGDAGWAGVLAEAFLEDANRQVFIVFEPGMELLPLLAEAISLLPPERRWEVTFSTFATSIPTGVECHWRCVLAGSPEANQSRRHVRALRIDLTEQLPQAVGGPLVEVARTGKRPVEQETRTAVPPVPVPPVGQAGSRRAGTYRLGDAEERYSRKVPADRSPPPLRPNGRRWGFNPLLAGAIMLLMLTGLITGTVWKSRGQTATAKPKGAVAEKKQEKEKRKSKASVATADDTQQRPVAPADPAAQKIALTDSPTTASPVPPPPPPMPTPNPENEADAAENAVPPKTTKKKESVATADSGTSANSNVVPGDMADPPKDVEKPKPDQRADHVIYSTLPEGPPEFYSTIATLENAPEKFDFAKCRVVLFAPEQAQRIEIQRNDSQTRLLELLFTKKTTEQNDLTLARLAISHNDRSAGSWNIQFRWIGNPKSHKILSVCAVQIADGHHSVSVVFHKPRTIDPVTVGMALDADQIESAWEDAKLQLSLKDIVLKTDDRTCESEDSDDTGSEREEVTLTCTPAIDAFSGIRLAFRNGTEKLPAFELEYSLAKSIGSGDTGFRDGNRMHGYLSSQEGAVFREAKDYRDRLQIKPTLRLNNSVSLIEKDIEEFDEKLSQLGPDSSQRPLFSTPRAVLDALLQKFGLIADAQRHLQSFEKAKVVRGVIQVKLVSTDPGRRSPPFYADLIRIRPEEDSKDTDDKPAGDTEDPSAQK